MKNWNSFTEKEPVWPFEKVDEALEETGLRLALSKEFDPSPHRPFTQNPILDPAAFAPQVKLVIDQDLLAEKSGLSAKQLMASVVVRDRAIRRFICVGSWPCEEANGKVISVDEAVIESLSGRRDVEIVALLTPIKNSGKYFLGDRIAEKVFECGVAGDTRGGFPMTIIDPSEPYWDKAYSEDTAWYISWKAHAMFDSKNDAEHVLKVVYNKQCADKILHFENDGNRAAGLFNVEMAVEVFHEVACVYLAPPKDSTDPPDFTKPGFYPKIVTAICKMMDVETSLSGYDQLKQEYRAKVGFMSLLRSKLQEFYGLKQRIMKVKVV